MYDRDNRDSLGFSLIDDSDTQFLRRTDVAASAPVQASSAQTAQDIAALVHAWFQTYLGRTSPAEEASWVAVVTNGQYSLDYVRDGIANSYEALSRLVPGWFLKYLGRNSPDEEHAWAVSGYTARQVEEGIANSGEATSRRLAMGQPATVTLAPPVVQGVLSVATPGAPARLVTAEGAVTIAPDAATASAASPLVKTALLAGAALLAAKLLKRRGRR